MLRTRRALSGISMPKASSTALTEARAWTMVQTPQILCAQIQASLGSRPRRINSIPRNIVPELQASVMTPPSTWASMRRCPSIRVTGSTTIRAMPSSLSFRTAQLLHGLESAPSSIRFCPRPRLRPPDEPPYGQSSAIAARCRLPRRPRHPATPMAGARVEVTARGNLAYAAVSSLSASA